MNRKLNGAATRTTIPEFESAARDCIAAGERIREMGNPLGTLAGKFRIGCRIADLRC